ncbi:MAG: hypothetical protein AB7F65_06080 [Dehalococcoidia bacterium]
MHGILRAMARPFDWLFRIANGHGDHHSARDHVDAHLKGGLSDANAEAKMGPPGSSPGGGLF